MSASGATASLNPYAPAGKQIHLFYNTNKQNLGVQFRNEQQSGGDQTVFVAGADAQDGIILSPAQIASTNLTGADIVVGFTEKAAPATTGGNPKPATQNDVSIISPVYLPLAATEVSNLTIAATSSGSTAWVYYLTGAESHPPTINEVFLGDDAPGDLTNTTKILPGSSLAAYYIDADATRYIIYQSDKTKRLHEYSPNPQNVWDKELVNSGDAKPKTSITVTYVDAKAYLYYIDNSDQLRVIIKNGEKWGGSSAVASAASPVDDASQITVVPAPNGNHIFYVGQGQSSKFQFHHIIDKRV